MPSIRGYITSWVIWLLFYRTKRASEKQVLLNAKSEWRQVLSGEVIPSKMASARDMRIDEEIYKGKQEWKVWHCKPTKKVGGGGKVVVYWHGGAFMKGAAIQHWTAVRRLVTESNATVIFPQYKLAPLSTADEWSSTTLDFLLHISQDERYNGKEIVHMGDSAGGWMVLRIRQMLCGIMLGEEYTDLTEEKKEALGRVLDSMGAGIMISPALTMEITPPLLKKDKIDPWLSVELLKAMRAIWCRGPTITTSQTGITFDLPKEYQRQLPSEQGAEESDNIYAEPRYTLLNNFGVFSRYYKAFPDKKPFHLLTMIGTHDLCHVGTSIMEERLRDVGGEVLTLEVIEEEGLFHVYPLIDMPETERAWAKINPLVRP